MSILFPCDRLAPSCRLIYFPKRDKTHIKQRWRLIWSRAYSFKFLLILDNIVIMDSFVIDNCVVKILYRDSPTTNCGLDVNMKLIFQKQVKRTINSLDRGPTDFLSSTSPNPISNTIHWSPLDPDFYLESKNVHFTLNLQKQVQE